MRVSVTFTPVELESRDVSEARVVVIDCFRASTSVVTALASGAVAVYPFLGIREALEEKAARPTAILAGERGGVKIDGFDLGNSPREFSSPEIAGSEIIMTTTNGTRLLAAAVGAGELLTAGFVNAAATASALAGSGGDVILAAAGTEGYFSIEDVLCAGFLVRLLGESGRIETDDQAAFAMAAAKCPWDAVRRMALGGRGADNVRTAGHDEDLENCLRIDTIPLVARVTGPPLVITRG
ncbi:MAG: 2-phosphosulfolactate phosphatase [Planctomycetes bacterium]|nr:2-phosphosulfolactate phosphatase [Planctomycetota bacterium]